ncbi:MAG: signal peptidase I [Oscillospiraceae bacterium]|nr:signal peptidase I [Oscillospiraceae bacterium]
MMYDPRQESGHFEPAQPYMPMQPYAPAQPYVPAPPPYAQQQPYYPAYAPAPAAPPPEPERFVRLTAPPPLPQPEQLILEINSYLDFLDSYEEDSLPPFFETGSFALNAVPESVPEEAPKPSAKKHPLRRVLMILLNILPLLVFVCIIFGVIIHIFDKNPDKSLFGFRFYNVISDSMTPTTQEDGTKPRGGFYAGDYIIVKKISPEDVRAGDIVTFWKNDWETVTHRVLDVLDRYNGTPGIFFITKGDHNEAADIPPVPGRALAGKKVASIRGLGHVMKLTQQYPRSSAAVCAVMFLSSGFLFVWLSTSDYRKKKRS